MSAPQLPESKSTGDEEWVGDLIARHVDDCALCLSMLIAANAAPFDSTGEPYKPILRHVFDSMTEQEQDETAAHVAAAKADS